MTQKEKGRNRWRGATPHQPSNDNLTLTPSSIKAELVRQALDGEISYGPATWLIRQGGLIHA
jgi:hypothetical protein